MEQSAAGGRDHPGDIRIALVWTGHLQSVYRGELDAAVLKAAQAWQKSKGHALAAKLRTSRWSNSFRTR